MHMTPREVGGLQALAQAHGGSLTHNPHTGLPEAGFLSSLLPTIIGGALAMTGIGAPMAAMMVGGGETLLSGGNLGKGLMAGLGAFGGAGLASALGAGAGASAASAAGSAASPSAFSGLSNGASSAFSNPAIAQTAEQVAPWQLGTDASTLPWGAAGGVGSAFPETAGTVSGLAQAAPTQGPLAAFMQTHPALGGVAQKFQGATAIRGIPGMATTGAGLAGLTSPLMQPVPLQVPQQKSHFDYQGPYQMPDRGVRFQGAGADPNNSSEFSYFNDTNPIPGFMPSYAGGGPVALKDGAFVVDARTVSELGNGSSGAGQDMLAQYGGMPIQGRGDGVSDSIPAQMAGGGEARVARDEVHFSPEAVKHIGRGNARKGATKLYALMAKAQAARAQAGRGDDTGLRSLL